ncbi:MAG: hypothetical protein AB8G96_03410 [Phycisphaerales bacterium]
MPASSLPAMPAIDGLEGLGSSVSEGLSGGWTGGLPIGIVMVLLVGFAAWLAGGRLLRVVLAGTGALFIGSLGWTIAGEAALPGPPIAWAALSGAGGALIGLAATRIAVAGLAAMILGAAVPVVAHHQWSRQDSAALSASATAEAAMPPPAMRVSPGPLQGDAPAGALATAPAGVAADAPSSDHVTDRSTGGSSPPATRSRSGEIVDSVSDWLTRQGERTRELERARANPPADRPATSAGPMVADSNTPDPADPDRSVDPAAAAAGPIAGGGTAGASPLATATPALAAEAGEEAARRLGFDADSGREIARRGLDAARAGLDHPAGLEARSVAARWWLDVDPSRRPTMVGLALAGALVGAAGGLVFAGAASRIVTAAAGSLLVLAAGMALFGSSVGPALAKTGLLPADAVAAAEASPNPDPNPGPSPDTGSNSVPSMPPVDAAIQADDDAFAPASMGLSDLAIAAPAATAGTWLAMTLLGAAVQWRYRPRVSDITR